MFGVAVSLLYEVAYKILGNPCKLKPSCFSDFERRVCGIRALGRDSSAPNAVVMDLFGGSGSTLMACDQTDRICYTMELDERYASVIVDRYIQFHEGASQNVKVIRDDTELSYEEAVAETRAAE